MIKPAKGLSFVYVYIFKFSLNISTHFLKLAVEFSRE